jgi:FAD/FMN-containing dehydrogenase
MVAKSLVAFNIASFQPLASERLIPRQLALNLFAACLGRRGCPITVRMNDTRVEQFHRRLRGRLLRPGDDGYDGARKVYNAMVDKRPALIARCTDAADVIACVEFARDRDLIVSVRGGGHSIPGKAVCDGGLMIDLSLMKGIRVDPAARTADAQPGLTWGEFDRETQAFGLATTGGVVTTTGIAGLTLGGGLGWLMPKHGLSCDNLISVDMVTAEGRLVTASETENADLFWGLRGGGGNFGIVTRFEYRLHEVGPLLAGPVIHPVSKATEMLRFYREWSAAVPDGVMSFPAILPGPDGRPVAAIPVAFCGSPSEGEKVLAPLRGFGPPVADLVEPRSYLQVQGMFDHYYPPGWFHYWRSGFLAELSDDAIDTIVAYASECPTPGTSIVFLEDFHGAARRPAGETAFANRDHQYNFVINAVSPNPDDSEKNSAWVRRFWEAMRPYSAGRAYVNYLGEEGEDRVREAYGPNYDRLVALKNKYDPANFFRVNQNIRPSQRRSS